MECNGDRESGKQCNGVRERWDGMQSRKEAWARHMMSLSMASIGFFL